MEERQENEILLEVLIEKGSAAVSCNANRTKTVCRTVEQMNSFFVQVNNLDLLALLKHSERIIKNEPITMTNMLTFI